MTPRKTVFLLGAAGLLLLSPIAVAQAPDAKTGHKAVWEAINYPADWRLTDVFFASPEEGWIAGGASTMTGPLLLHTEDGGASWTMQLGDPESSERPFGQLRFVDGRIGFVVQGKSDDHLLLRTLDGRVWEPSGEIPEHRVDYAFVSADTGYVSVRGGILRTIDGGRHWQSVFECRATTTVQGLVRQIQCHPDALHFLDENRGFALAHSFDAEAVFFASTGDGGQTWQISRIIDNESGREGAIHFTDPQNGSLRTQSGRLFYTSDGGATWKAATGPAVQGKPDIQFVGPTGWAIGAYGSFAFTTDGGRNWSSRQLRLPATIGGFALASPSRGYLVGDHGMIYRYIVVAANDPRPGLLEAPLMAPPQLRD